jgi:hypothetical protein
MEGTGVVCGSMVGLGFNTRVLDIVSMWFLLHWTDGSVVIAQSTEQGLFMRTMLRLMS